MTNYRLGNFCTPWWPMLNSSRGRNLICSVELLDLSFASKRANILAPYLQVTDTATVIRHSQRGRHSSSEWMPFDRSKKMY